MAENIIGKLDSIAAKAVASLNDRERAILDKRMAVRNPVRVPDIDPLLEPGDKVLRVFDGAIRAGEVESVAGSFATVSSGVWHRRMVALLPPDADSDLAAIVNTLGNAIVLALRRRIPAVPFGCPVGAWLHRVCVPAVECLPGSTSGVNDSHCFLAAHECAYAACVGDTPREALHWLASELYYQLRALCGDRAPLVAWALTEMAEANAPLLRYDSFTNECSGDAIALWVDAFETMAMMARAAAPAEASK